jgi:hypothetical protein
MVVTACPATVPSYMTDVAPIIQRRCVLCHSSTGVESIRPYETYAEVKKFQIDILTQLHACPPRMPPVGAVQLSLDELNTILGWLYCDAPNN